MAKTPLRNTLLAYALPRRLAARDGGRCVAGLVQSAGALGDRGPRRGRPAAGDGRVDSHEPLAAGAGEQSARSGRDRNPAAGGASRRAAGRHESGKMRLRPLLDKAEASGGRRGQSRRRARRSPAVAVRVVDGTVLVEETATGQRWRLHRAQRTVRFARRRCTACRRFRCRASSTRGSRRIRPSPPRSFALALTNDRGPATTQLATAETFRSRRRSRGCGSRCRVRRSAAGCSDKGPRRGRRPRPIRSAIARTSGTLTLQSVDFTAPELAGDHVRLASVELPWRLTSQPGGVTIEDLQLKSDVGRFAARGTLDPTMFARAMIGAATRCLHDVEFRARSISRRWPRCCRTCCGFAATQRSPPAGCSWPAAAQPIEGGQSLSGSAAHDGPRGHERRPAAGVESAGRRDLRSSPRARACCGSNRSSAIPSF